MEWSDGRGAQERKGRGRIGGRWVGLVAATVLAAVAAGAPACLKDPRVRTASEVRALRNEEFERLLAPIKRQLETYPHNPVYNVAAGSLYATRGRCSDAMRYFATALVGDPDSYEAYYGLGLCKSKLKNFNARSPWFT